MIKFSTGNGAWMAVEVPKGAGDFHIIHAGKQLAWFIPRYKRIPIPPPYAYTIIGIASEMTEAQCSRFD